MGVGPSFTLPPDVPGGDHAQPVHRPQRLPVEHLQQRGADAAGGIQRAAVASSRALCRLRHHPAAGRPASPTFHPMNSGTHSGIEFFFVEFVIHQVFTVDASRTRKNCFIQFTFTLYFLQQTHLGREGSLTQEKMLKYNMI